MSLVRYVFEKAVCILSKGILRNMLYVHALLHIHYFYYKSYT